RVNCKIEESITSMLAEAKLPRACWLHAAALAVCILNATPTSAIKNKTPHEAFYGKKPDLSMLRVFGCCAYVHIQKKHRGGAPPPAPAPSPPASPSPSPSPSLPTPSQPSRPQQDNSEYVDQRDDEEDNWQPSRRRPSKSSKRAPSPPPSLPVSGPTHDFWYKQVEKPKGTGKQRASPQVSDAEENIPLSPRPPVTKQQKKA
ncbi:hypothetical protein FRB97_005528, partial [Tulasnella sp. 331]